MSTTGSAASLRTKYHHPFLTDHEVEQLMKYFGSESYAEFGKLLKWMRTID
jgi:hypothetical protein